MGLPLMIVAFILFMGLGLGSVALIVLFLGQAIVAPLAIFGLQSVAELFAKGDYSKGFHVPMTDVSMIVPSEVSIQSHANVFPSWWVGHVLFFLGFLLSNAVSVYTMESDVKASEWAVQNRTARAVSIIVVVVIAMLGLPLARKALTNAETWMGIFLGGSVLGVLGYLWYWFAEFCGARQADVFGIVQQILPPSSQQEAAMTCVYSPTP
jgi:hypothetical protein